MSPSASRLLRHLIVNGQASRTELAHVTGLTAGAITRAVQPLLRADVLQESAGRESTAAGRRSLGRPATALSVRADRHLQAGIKITDDRLIAVVVTLQTRVIDSMEQPLGDREPAQVVRQIADTVIRLRDRHPELRRVGLALAGDVDRESGRVGYSPFLDWRDVDVSAPVASAIGLPVVVENDVRALLTGERWYGVGAGASSVGLITIGTGIGCALVLHGQVVGGSHGVAGEVAHVLVDPRGPRCHCGNRGCVEAIAGAAAIRTRMADVGWPGLDVADVAILARDGHPDAIRVMAEAGRAVGIGIATVANLFGPERMIITGEAIVERVPGGGESAAEYDAMEPYLREEFERRAFGSARCDLEIRALQFTDWARGAAACAIEELITGRRT